MFPLVSILTGIRTLGVEVQPDYAARAQEAARGLDLSRVRFAAADARNDGSLKRHRVLHVFALYGLDPHRCSMQTAQTEYGAANQNLLSWALCTHPARPNVATTDRAAGHRENRLFKSI